MANKDLDWFYVASPKLSWHSAGKSQRRAGRRWSIEHAAQDPRELVNLSPAGGASQAPSTRRLADKGFERMAEGLANSSWRQMVDHQYLPKGINLSISSQDSLDAIARELNQRPRKTLGYRTPAEMFDECVASIG